MSKEERDSGEIVRQFRDAVNMTVDELREWLATPQSREVGWTHEGESESVGHHAGRDILALLGKKRGDGFDEAELAQMRRVVGYVHRHLAQGPGEDVAHSRWRYSLMNWGHDPVRDGRGSGVAGRVSRDAAEMPTPPRAKLTSSAKGASAGRTAAAKSSATRARAASAEAPARGQAKPDAATRPRRAARTPKASATTAKGRAAEATAAVTPAAPPKARPATGRKAAAGAPPAPKLGKAEKKPTATARVAGGQKKPKADLAATAEEVKTAASTGKSAAARRTPAKRPSAARRGSTER